MPFWLSPPPCKYRQLVCFHLASLLKGGVFNFVFSVWQAVWSCQLCMFVWVSGEKGKFFSWLSGRIKWRLCVTIISRVWLFLPELFSGFKAFLDLEEHHGWISLFGYPRNTLYSPLILCLFTKCCLKWQTQSPIYNTSAGRDLYDNIRS